MARISSRRASLAGVAICTSGLLDFDPFNEQSPPRNQTVESASNNTREHSKKHLEDCLLDHFLGTGEQQTWFESPRFCLRSLTRAPFLDIVRKSCQIPHIPRLRFELVKHES